MKPLNTKRNLLLLAGFFASTAFITTSALAQGRTDFGTIASPTAKNSSLGPITLGSVLPSDVFTDSGYGTGGVALRNRGTGNISVSGVVGTVKAAFLYWAVITLGPPAAPESSIQIQQVFPNLSDNVVLVGTPVGTGGDPCWDGDRITVFKASIPLAVATGNGSYQLTLNPGAGGRIDGANPWDPLHVLPLWEGASMVMIGDPDPVDGGGPSTVAVYDAGLAGNTFVAGPVASTYSLTLPVAASGKSAFLDNIGADGQHGVSRTPFVGTEATTINGVNIAGPGSLYNDSDWNGSSGLPLPELWDDTGHDITAATPAGTLMLNVSISDNPGGDCLTPVANVVKID